MTTIHIVTSGSYSDYSIDGVFSSKEKAQEFISTSKRGEIEEWTLDAHLPGSSLSGFEVRMLFNGDVEKVTRLPHGVGESTSSDMRVAGRADVFTVCTWAKDADHATKIAADKLAEFLTANPDKIPKST